MASERERIRKFLGYGLTELAYLQQRMDTVAFLSEDAIATAQHHLSELQKSGIELMRIVPMRRLPPTVPQEVLPTFTPVNALVTCDRKVRVTPENWQNS